MPYNRAEAENALTNVQRGDLKALAETLRTFFRGPVQVTSSTLDLNNRDYLNRTIVQNAAAGCVFTLPPATGGGDKVRIICQTTITSNALKVQVANAADTMTGVAILGQDGGDTVVLFETASTSDTVSGNGTTTGGVKGDCIELEDIASNLWYVRFVGSATGTEATPFSAAV
jgi:hypothetical protein